MIPHFLATGNLAYAKYVHLYLQQMSDLENKMTHDEFQEFSSSGTFTIRRMPSAKLWTGLWNDMTIEQVLMRAMKSSGGITHGRGLIDSALSRWVLGKPSCIELTCHFQEFCGIKFETSEQHVDLLEWRLEADRLVHPPSSIATKQCIDVSKYWCHRKWHHQLLCHTYKLFERYILNRIAEHVDAKLIPEQAGFRPGKSCTSQLLDLTEHIEDGYEKRLITGGVFVDLSAAYDTVNHRPLLSKVPEMTGDVQLTDLIRTMLESRRLFVVLNGKKSRWRRQRNGLPQGSVLASMLFNIYTNDQPIHPDTRCFIYADDLCIASQWNDFNNIEASLTSALSTMTTYYDTKQLRALQRHRCALST